MVLLLKTKTRNSLVVTTLPCSLSRPKRKAELILLPVVSKTEKSFLTCFSTKRCLCLQREKGKTHKTICIIYLFSRPYKNRSKTKNKKVYVVVATWYWWVSSVSFLLISFSFRFQSSKFNYSSSFQWCWTRMVAQIIECYRFKCHFNGPRKRLDQKMRINF